MSQINKRKHIVSFLILASIFYLGLQVLVKNSGRDGVVDDVDRYLSEEVPQISKSDYIMRMSMDAPIVVEEFKLVFFIIPKVACSEWKHLFSRMMGKPPLLQKQIHQKRLNGLKILAEFPTKEAQEIMTSDDWTKAVFLREPKERVLSAFLDKFVKQDYHFFHFCCKDLSKEDQAICRQKQQEKDFSYFLERTKDCKDPHWKPQRFYVDEKWWPSVNYIGFMGNLENQVHELLATLRSTVDGKTAWEKYGRTGWGENGNQAFLHRDVAPHATHAHDKLREYYNKCDEAFVEDHWHAEWQSPSFTFKKKHLYNTTEADVAQCKL